MDYGDLRDGVAVRELEAEWRERVAEILRRIARSASDVRRVLAHSGHDDQGLSESLSALRGQLLQTLEAEDAELFGVIGDKIDPTRHKVIEMREAAAPENTVLEVESEGLLWEGKLLEKAEVIGSRSPAGKA